MRKRPTPKETSFFKVLYLYCSENTMSTPRTTR